MIKAVLFDVDGTLIDSNDLHAAAWGEAFRHYGVDLPHDVIRSQIGAGAFGWLPKWITPQDAARPRELADEITRFFALGLKARHP